MAQDRVSWSVPIIIPDETPEADIVVEEAAEAGNAATTSEPTFLAIQHAESGSISEINATTYTLELNNVSDTTILFSDRPDRIVTSITTANFVGNWTAGADSFAADPPNAVLVVHDEEEKEDISIIELFNPIYDATTNSLKYDIIPENATSIDLPSELGGATLIVDNAACHFTSAGLCTPPP